MTNWLMRMNVFHLIAGVNQNTIVGVRFKDNEFTYLTSNQGDGTVPLDFARLPGTNTYFVEESHGSLANNFNSHQIHIRHFGQW